MWTNEKRAAEVKQRLKDIQCHKRQRECCMVTALSVAVCMVFIIGASLAMPGIMARANLWAYVNEYGAAAGIFAESAVIGHIVIGLLSFVLGVCVTALYYHMKALNAHTHRTERDNAGDDR